MNVPILLALLNTRSTLRFARETQAVTYWRDFESRKQPLIEQAERATNPITAGEDPMMVFDAVMAQISPSGGDLLIDLERKIDKLMDDLES